MLGSTATVDCDSRTHERSAHVSVITARAVPRTWQRRGTTLGIPAVLLLAVSFVLAASGPGTSDSDAKISSWYAKSSHQHMQILGYIGFTLGAICLIGFLAALREQMASAEDTPSAMPSLAFGAGLVSAGLFALSIGLFSVPGLLASDTSAAEVVPSSYRMLYTAGVASWCVATMVAAVTVFAASVSALRTGLLPRWFAWIGVVIGVALLAGYLFIPAFAFWAWVLVTATLLLRRAPAGSASGTFVEARHAGVTSTSG
jgi:hypothetical protein